MSGDTGSGIGIGSAYKLVFNDEFNGNFLDEEKWSFKNYMNGYSDLILKSTPDVAAVTTDADGNGILRFTASSYSTGKYKTSKSVTTGGKMSFKYGYLEIRAKVPVGQGVWPSFWLLSSAGADTPAGEKLGYNSRSVYETEVDVFEIFGSDILTPNLHKWWKTQEQIDTYGGYRVSAGTDHTYTLPDTGWHTYGMLWTPNEISMFVDGTCYKSYNLNENFCNEKSADVDMTDFHNPLCIIFNNHLFTPAYTGTAGGAWASRYTVPENFTSAVFEIDYVRLYQKPVQSKIYYVN